MRCERVSEANFGLVILRNWLGEGRRSAIDAAIRAAQQKAISAAPRPAVQINEILVSACDGAGAQSWFVILRERRKFAIAALLTKHGFGLRDAWVRRGLTGAEIKAFLAQIEFEMYNFTSSLESVGTALEHGLAVHWRKESDSVRAPSIHRSQRHRLLQSYAAFARSLAGSADRGSACRPAR
jgi:hypothetical protein